MAELKDISPSGNSPNRQDTILARVIIGFFIVALLLVGGGVWWLSSMAKAKRTRESATLWDTGTEKLASLVVMSGHDKPELMEQVEGHKPAVREWIHSLPTQRRETLRRAAQALADAVIAGDAELMRQMAEGDLDVDRLVEAGAEQTRWFIDIAGFSNVWHRMESRHREGFQQLKRTVDQGLMATALTEGGPYATPTNIPPELDRQLTTSMLQHGSHMLAGQLDLTRERTTALIHDIFDSPRTVSKTGRMTLAARVIGGLLLLVWLYFIPVGRKVMMAQGQMMHATVFQFNILPFIVGMSLIVSGSLWFLLVLPAGFLLSPTFPRFFMYSFPVGFGWATGAHIMTGLFPESRAWYWGGGALGVLAMFIFCSVVVGIVTSPPRSRL